MLQEPSAVRHHFTVYKQGEATGLLVAGLFEEAARRMESLGSVFIRHTAIDTSDDARCSEVSLTIYYDLDPTARRA